MAHFDDPHTKFRTPSTYAEISEQTGMSEATLSRILRGRRVGLGIKHLFTQPYTPKTNGKAERFIQSATREWAYSRTYQNSDERTAALPVWLQRYNWRRPHRSLKRKPPVSRLYLEDNVLTTHT